MVSAISRRVNDDAYRLPFGKYAGRTLDEVPRYYAVWLADEAESPTLRKLARRSLDLDDDDDEGAEGAEPSAALAAVVLPGRIFLWWQDLRALYADDPLALSIIDVAFKKLKSLCVEYTNQPWPDEPATPAAAPAAAPGERVQTAPYSEEILIYA